MKTARLLYDMNIASFIDHTLLRPDCNLQDVKKLCAEAKQYSFAAVCVPPFFVSDAAQLLSSTPIKVATVAGFPMGYATTAAKVEEIKRAIDDGADEIDTVINICAVKGANWKYVRDDIDRVATAARLKGKVLKIILETGLLSEAEITKLCEICLEVGPDFVKTSTGLNGEGATVQTVRMLNTLLKGNMKIKASGGIRTREEAERLIEAGAKRIGSSASVLIVTE